MQIIKISLNKSDPTKVKLVVLIHIIYTKKSYFLDKLFIFYILILFLYIFIDKIAKFVIMIKNLFLLLYNATYNSLIGSYLTKNGSLILYLSYTNSCSLYSIVFIKLFPFRLAICLRCILLVLYNI